ncbi:hypothetical protein [Algicella marina]|uniref:Uncharacterized protein n=1 Tax=Algicella marina TaxID=2683284 RepID=A0A6P1SZZ1_9RHOB|nr:hypothetical protein [Algicella marina]QHQ34943.1 hypothetical protein GO499_06900 [Algicella marina]
MKLSFAMCLLAVTSAATADVPSLITAPELAACLDLSDQLDAIDIRVLEHTERASRVDADLRELGLRERTLFQTAQIDATVATALQSVQAEIRAAENALHELRDRIRAALKARREVSRRYEADCAGRTYSASDLRKAQALRR